MVAEGPTTAGSINAKLTLDDAQFMAKLAAADAAARKLGSVDPNISVDVDDRGAITKLAAVDAAAKKLDGTNRSLNASMRDVNNTNGAGIQRWQLIAAAIVALIPLLAPLAGYALGVAGALAGMGAAGGLAIYGIIRALGSGSAAGGEFQVQLNKLKSVLDSLGNTAANAVLASFKQAVAQINAALPMMNSQIDTFGRILGNVGNSVLASVISGLRILNPLFVEASAYVLQLARGFQSWVQGGGLQTFANYARTQLPVVAELLNQLIAAALHVAQAFAPLGSAVVQGLTLLAGAINAIPLPVLMTIGVAAVAGFAGFKLWAVLQPILSSVATAIGAVGAATQLAAGPIGWVTAGVSALAGVLAASVISSQQAQQSAVDYANALQQDNDVIGENVRLLAVKNLHDSGAIRNAHLLGISTAELTSAATGNSAAYDHVTSVLDGYQKSLASTGAVTGEGTKKQNEQYTAIRNISEALGHESKALAEGATRQREKQDAMKGASDTLITNKGLVQALTDAEGKAADATDRLSKLLKGLGQVNLDASQANIQYNQSLADAAAAAKQYGQSLDVTTDAGRKNMSALDSIASSATALIAAQAKAGTSTDVLTANMASARQAFIDTAMKMGATADEANHLADQYELVPSKIPTAVELSGVQAARSQIAGLQDQIDNLHGKTVFINTVTQNPANVRGGPYATGRTGGTITGLAGGGGGSITGAGNAFTDTAGLFRLANGEEVVSNMYGQASQWRSALKLMNSGADRLKVASAVNRIAGGTPSQQAPVYVTVTSNGVDLSKYIDVKVRQGGTQLLNQFAHEMDGGLVV